MASKSNLRYIDIGANLTDSMFRGEYHGKRYHSDDFEDMLKRADDAGLDRIIVTGGTLSESAKALEIARAHERLYCTVGCHPTRCDELEQGGAKYLEDLLELIKSGGDKVRYSSEFRAYGSK